ncbi:E3 UFM1-protein ligase 1 [Thelohanellus kitauei]|uniref:E3 UFM1-protein ligase 1 n=1 Tax=Thelohanellus kitauei TaxID=669202 RepID=A0A0C2MZC8_THEKT|nr:E3 UFM1-protein ligase 1 [Thelohanellus kitauei]
MLFNNIMHNQNENTSRAPPLRYRDGFINFLNKGESLDAVRTSDGKEQDDGKKIKQEIRNIIEENGGRIKIFVLTQDSYLFNKYLNVDRRKVLKYSKEVCAESYGYFHLMNEDEIFTKIYIDRFVQEMQKFLQTEGLTCCNELSTRLAVPVEFLFEVTMFS